MQIVVYVKLNLLIALPVKPMTILIGMYLISNEPHQYSAADFQIDSISGVYWWLLKWKSSAS